MRITFPTHKQKVPSKNTLFGGTVYKIVTLCIFLCIDTILLWKWLKWTSGSQK